MATHWLVLAAKNHAECHLAHIFRSFASIAKIGEIGLFDDLFVHVSRPV